MYFFTVGVSAQSLLEEGIIYYKSDSIINPANSSCTPLLREIRIYKKGNLYRAEFIKKDEKDTRLSEMEVQLINREGKYLFKAVHPFMDKMALFITLEDEKQRQAERSIEGHLKTYKLRSIKKEESLLAIPVKRAGLANVIDTMDLDVLIADKIAIGFGLFFEEYRKIAGTPLRFYDKESDCFIRYTATHIDLKQLPASLFEMDSEYKIITLDQVTK
ncbi:hypothetical protein [Spirosoma endbachense]|uniref:Uncharacterized protein n=1 Tax=Spirosoma endbachense TaxID=2666025 RepID=A0A6P1W2K9_9BACT|nr:hypothetical protein [Spirosoma endbachense]QHV98239.1 hypothetical protein GJR95_25980 [Spirosoma endbachense]